MYNNRTKVKLKNAFYDLNLMIYIYLVHTHTLWTFSVPDVVGCWWVSLTKINVAPILIVHKRTQNIVLLFFVDF